MGLRRAGALSEPRRAGATKRSGTGGRSGTSATERARCGADDPERRAATERSRGLSSAQGLFDVILRGDSSSILGPRC